MYAPVIMVKKALMILGFIAVFILSSALPALFAHLGPEGRTALRSRDAYTAGSLSGGAISGSAALIHP